MANSFAEALAAQGLGQQPAAPAAASSFSEALAQQSIPETPKDAFGNNKPFYASGLNPLMPLNDESPVSATDRLKLAVGNRRGQIEFLKKNYGEVDETAKGDLVVKDKADGLWKRVDPDAWEATKDAMDLLPTAGKIAASVGAGALTGGASLLAQFGVQGVAGAAGAGLESSLGRLAGTYNDTPEQQLADAGFEGLLNAAGVFIPPGAKLAKEALGKVVSKVGANIPSLGSAAEAGAKRMMNIFSKVPVEEMDTLTSAPANVGKKVTEITAGRTPEQAVTYTKDKLFPVVSQFADDIVSSTQKIFSRGKDALPKFFDVDHTIKGMDTLSSSSAQVFEHNGLGKWVTSRIDPDTGVSIALQKPRFEWLSADDVWDKIGSTGEVAQGLGLEKKATLDLLQKVQTNFESMAKANMLKGPAGVKTAADLYAEQKLILDQLAGVADKTNNASLIGVVKQLKDATTGVFDQALTTKNPIPVSSLLGEMDPAQLQALGIVQDASGLTTQPLTVLNKFYELAAADMQPLKAVTSAGRSTAAAEQLLGKLTGGTKQATRTSTDRLVSLIQGASKGDAALSRTANRITQTAQDMREYKAAMAFTPWANPGLVSKQMAMAGVGSAMLGNPALATTLGVGVAAGSPRLQYSMIQAALNARRVLATLGSDKAIAKAAKANPQMFADLYESINRVPEMHNAIKGGLVQTGVQAIQSVRGGGQQGGQ